MTKNTISWLRTFEGSLGKVVTLGEEIGLETEIMVEETTLGETKVVTIRLEAQDALKDATIAERRVTSSMNVLSLELTRHSLEVRGVIVKMKTNQQITLRVLWLKKNLRYL